MATDQKLGTTELLYRRAEHMGLQPAWLTNKGLFAITVDGEERYIHFACSPLNSHVGVNLARNKYLTRLVLERNKLQNIPFARPKTHQEAIAFLDVHKKIIAKPVRGFGSHDIHIITTAQELEALTVTRYILEKYITGAEMRYLVLNQEVIGVHRSEYGVSVAETRPLQRLSYAQDDWDAKLVDLSLLITRLMGLQFAAVDYLIDDTGRTYVLEVNTAPGLKWFHAPTSGPVVDVASMFLESILKK
jgi:glutathione synthase/RimK-type ligase-like ATP-grasp enzyme